ncbi:GNAT family N-acetyltransferase [Paludicola sp. MB14-C6]|uniref:GNAT family N-acetyltransferase n=1 Tax=Paludihabitans sp. MB14-C6 TaxID=3070656 RepID=UPI0027DD8CC8|nr:GNAT family N-acetyltransferase [Paludicola sp. MB14-C6]WMJ23242.1 GNAT family N-acetyltransferase [Paludicola sp. MB14-C6]
MVVRKIKEDELKRTSELFCIAFEFDMDNVKSPSEVYEEAISNPKSRWDLYWQEKWGAFDHSNNMMAFVSAQPYTVQFDDNIVKMTGIGAVSTLPQYRRNGCIRKCFETALNDMYENDFTFSYLYPFSSAYYRKFGYELCNEVIQYSINLKSIQRFPEADGQVYLVEHGSYLEDIKKVYNDFAKGYNLMCKREDIDYTAIKESNPAKDKHYIYVYKDKNGVAKGVMSFTKEKVNDHFNMQCRNFYFSDMDGFKGLMNHCLAFTAYYEHVVFKLPLDINITSYIPEWALYSYKRENYLNGMVRVVNVKKALEIAKYQGSGSLVMKISDNQIKQNDHIFEVVFVNGEATSVEVVEKPFDIAFSINDFSRLLIGTHNPTELKYIDQVQINAGLDKISKVFYKKLNFIADYF